MTNPGLPKSLPDGHLTSKMMCNAAGCTYRMLDYWVRNGWITPTCPASGSGSRVFYSLEQVERVRLMMAVMMLTGAANGNGSTRAHGQRMRKIWEQLEGSPQLLEAPWLYLTVTGDITEAPGYGYCITRDQWHS